MSTREHPQISLFKEVAEQFCSLFKSEVIDREHWVEQVLTALSSLYAAAHKIPEIDWNDSTLEIPHSFEVTIAEWQTVNDLVKHVLGRQEMYWAYFDPSQPTDTKEEPIFHSLADDLADIYGDLMPGLRAWAEKDERYLNSIMLGWKSPHFESHWGVHAVSAMRALHPLVYLRGLLPPSNAPSP